MANQNSQQRSRHSSAKSERSKPSGHPSPSPKCEDEEQYIDRTFDHVARVREAREAAQRRMEEFGDISEYDMTILQGQLPNASSREVEPTFGSSSISS